MRHRAVKIAGGPFARGVRLSRFFFKDGPRERLALRLGGGLGGGNIRPGFFPCGLGGCDPFLRGAGNERPPLCNGLLFYACGFGFSLRDSFYHGWQSGYPPYFTRAAKARRAKINSQYSIMNILPRCNPYPASKRQIWRLLFHKQNGGGRASIPSPVC